MSTLTTEQREQGQLVKEQLRVLIANFYDLQKLRIATGNRLVSSFYIKMGYKPSEKKVGVELSEKEQKEEDSKRKSFIAVLKSDYKKITDALSDMSVEKAIKSINASEKHLQVIRDKTDYALVDAYMQLKRSEDMQEKVLEKYVVEHPLWDNFFKQIKGCGTLMSAVCIAYLDPYKARHVSSFFMYCGLDTVQDKDKDGNPIFLTCEKTRRRVIEKWEYLDDDNAVYLGKILTKTETRADGTEEKMYFTDYDERLFPQRVIEDGDPVYTVIETDEDYVGEVVACEHGRRKGDTEMQDYIDKDGNVKKKRGITYNPIVKTKLMGVLTGCLIKAKDPVYTEIYYDYKKRLEKSDYHKDKKIMQREMMAERYMIKQFLRNLWTTWRALEGLPVDNPYEVEKLGHKPHKYNEYQCNTAKKSVL